ncbi:MAG TPA: type IV toxin-antitoxin system AbiEi family antitoxin domain-containing protein [Propionibacteriaceae bacterium]
MDETMAALAAEHGGIFTRAQAVDAGCSDRALTAAVRRGLIRRLRHGCYAIAVAYDALDETGRHLLHARAVLACQLGVVALTGPSAAALHGLVTWGQDLSVVHLVRLDRGSSRHEVGTKHHVLTHDIAKDLNERDGLPTVSVARAVWEVATLSSLEAAVCTADSALRMHPEIAGDLATIAGTFDRRPGSRQARMAVKLANGRSESPGESLSRVLFHRHKIPAPRLQHEVYDRDGVLVAITDFYWDEYGHVGEFDGKVKYSQYLRPGEAPGDAVFREKLREDAVRAQDLGVTRWTWRDLQPTGTQDFLRRLADDLQRSRSLFVRRSA